MFFSGMHVSTIQLHALIQSGKGHIKFFNQDRALIYVSSSKLTVSGMSLRYLVWGIISVAFVDLTAL